jgi:uncharacterized membrane protein YccC
MSAPRFVPDLDGWLFATKSFAAAMLALYIAMAADLDRPYWAMATVYIVSHPFSGAVRSKAIHRLLGTLAGAAAMIVLIPNLVDAPELLSAGIALWIGGCLYLSVLDRTPSSYGFMLAGYSAALIGFPLVSAPETVWDISVARVEEIVLGIVCATVIGSIVLPRPIGPVLSARLATWLRDADRLAADAIAPDGAPAAEVNSAQLRLAGDAVELRALVPLLAYDTSHLWEATEQVAALRQRMVILLPVLAAIRDRLADLRAIGGVTRRVEVLLNQVRAWIAADATAAAPDTAAFLRTEIGRLQDEADTRHGWDGALLTAVLVRLRQLVDLRADCIELQRRIIAGGADRTLPTLAMRLPERAPMHRDHGLALLRGAVAALALLAACAFSIATGWADGCQAAALAGVACCFTAARDDPVPVIKGLSVAVALAAVFAAIGQFVVLPRANGFEMLTLALAAFFIPAALLGVIPATQRLGAPLPTFTAVVLAMSGRYNADFAILTNFSSAALFGAIIAAVMSALVVPAGAAWSVRRRLRAGWADLAAAARSRAPMERTRLVGLFLDRMGLLAPLLAMIADEDQVSAVAAMAELRVGINLVDLNAQRRTAPPALDAALDEVLQGAAAHFDFCVARHRASPAPGALLRATDRALDAASALPGSSAREIVRALVGLRCTLFPQAAFYRPPAAAEPPQLVLEYQGGAA